MALFKTAVTGWRQDLSAELWDCLSRHQHWALEQSFADGYMSRGSSKHGFAVNNRGRKGRILVTSLTAETLFQHLTLSLIQHQHQNRAKRSGHHCSSVYNWMKGQIVYYTVSKLEGPISWHREALERIPIIRSLLSFNERCLWGKRKRIWCLKSTASTKSVVDSSMKTSGSRWWLDG